MNKTAEDEVFIPKKWGKLMGVAGGSHKSNVSLFFRADDGTIYIAQGFFSDFGKFILNPISYKILRTEK